MKEIGGYFELTSGNLPILHEENAMFVNSARNALRLIIRKEHIKHIYLPYYTCPVVWEAVQAEGCEISPYDIDENFYPCVDFPQGATILYTDYFGVCQNQITKLDELYPRLIVDSSQAFYAGARGWYSFNSPRKFFGLPDGGMLFGSVEETLYYEKQSYLRCTHLLKRHEYAASEAYSDFKEADAQLDKARPCLMSPLTRSLLQNINYDEAAARRKLNFDYVHEALRTSNKLALEINSNETPMVYPYMTLEHDLRQKLIDNKIYVAKYWSPIENVSCMRSAASQSMSSRIIPLPIDQRYSIEDMKRILEVIHG